MVSTSDVAPDDWDTHWENFADVAGRNPAQAFGRRIVLDLLTGAGGPRRYFDVGSGHAELAGDVDEGGRASPVVRAGMAVFDGLIGQSPKRVRRGWQVFAEATAPPS
jgi:hypothetical protein